MNVERKNTLKRDQALNDATSGQLGDQPRSKPLSDIKDQRMKTAHRIF